MSDEDCQQEEILGWLYQFYMFDAKGPMGFKKNEFDDLQYQRKYSRQLILNLEYAGNWEDRLTENALKHSIKQNQDLKFRFKILIL